MGSRAPALEALKIAKLARGIEALISHAHKALEDCEAQCRTHLCDHLMALIPDSNDAKFLKATALEKLAEDLITALGRNYCLSVAQELRAEAKK